MNKRYYLKDDVYSSSSGMLYGIAGTEVKVLSAMGEHINVVNVRDRHGNRFPVKIDKLTTRRMLMSYKHFD
jgi:hypothetical protein